MQFTKGLTEKKNYLPCTKAAGPKYEVKKTRHARTHNTRGTTHCIVRRYASYHHRIASAHCNRVRIANCNRVRIVNCNRVRIANRTDYGPRRETAGRRYACGDTRPIRARFVRVGMGTSDDDDVYNKGQ